MRLATRWAVGVAAVLAAFAKSAAEAAGFMGLGDLPGGDPGSFAEAVSADGSVVVGRSSTAAGSEAFRWTAATEMVGLGDLPGGNSSSVAFGVSADGSVVVGTSGSGNTEAFLWDSAHGMRDLQDVLIGQGADLTGWRLSESRGVSADGRTIVGWGMNPAGRFEAWLARLDAKAMPEPSGQALAGVGVVHLLGYAGRRRRA